MDMKFKTNAMCMGCVSAIKRAINEITPADNWSFDLSSADKVMSYVGTEPLTEEKAQAVESAVKAAGFVISRL